MASFASPPPAAATTPGGPSEFSELLPRKHDWDSGEDGRAIGFASPAMRRARGGRRRERTSLRHDVWTILRFRSSIQHRSSLQRASYAFELCILTLILLNVLLAMGVSNLIDGESPEVACTFVCFVAVPIVALLV